MEDNGGEGSSVGELRELPLAELTDGYGVHCF